MQSYHMAQILLKMNKPQESTVRKTTLYSRVNSYRASLIHTKYHVAEIIGISLGRPDASVRIHSVQPLFVAGQCVEEPAGRRLVLELLEDIERDTGWATAYRVRQLKTDWGWDEAGAE